MNDFEKKIQQMAMITAEEDVRTISGVPSWMLVLFQKILEVKRSRKHQSSLAKP